MTVKELYEKLGELVGTGYEDDEVRFRPTTNLDLDEFIIKNVSSYPNSYVTFLEGE